MKTIGRRVLCFLAYLLPALLAGATGLEPQEEFAWRTFSNTTFGAGEDFFYVVKWGIIRAGYSSLEIPEIMTQKGRLAYRIRSQARSTGFIDTLYRVDDWTESWVDCQSLCSVGYAKKLREGGYKIDEEVLLDQAAGVFHQRGVRLDKQGRVEASSGTLPSFAQDILSSLYYVRTQPLRVGSPVQVDVQNGDKVYPLVVKVHKKDTVKVPAGEFQCFLVEPLLRSPGIFIAKQAGRLEVWLTDDERRIPVRLRTAVPFGHVVAELVDYRLGTPRGCDATPSANGGGTTPSPSPLPPRGEGMGEGGGKRF